MNATVSAILVKLLVRLARQLNKTELHKLAEEAKKKDREQGYENYKI